LIEGFIELVDQEKWDEDGASFMALRQTLLTTLISTDEDADTYSSQFDKVIIDLTDPILSATKLDATIFNIILREFATTGAGESRLIGETFCIIHITTTKSMSVLNNSHEYLRSDSLLSKSLLSLATMRDGAHSMLLIGNDLLSINPTLISLSDFVIRGYPNPRSWAEYYRLHEPIQSSVPQEPQIRAGQVVITSRDVTRIREANGIDSSNSIIMDITELDTTSYQDDLLSPPPITYPKGEGEGSEMAPKDEFELEPNKGSFSDEGLTDPRTSPISALLLERASGSVSFEPKTTEDIDQSFPSDSLIVNEGAPLEPDPCENILEPSRNMDHGSLLLLVISLINNRFQVIQIQSWIRSTADTFRRIPSKTCICPLVLSKWNPVQLFLIPITFTH
jgi:hypothetical protein